MKSFPKVLLCGLVFLTMLLPGDDLAPGTLNSVLKQAQLKTR